ncbi:hypothetical protein VKT23_008408 [Stygiomarasmius scandens]|uniref:Uncharacterized protein n=1 Tax=Marasmiellus scandens TaxID=2682957 RepID=A0ABR1JNJ5_9AGAR
MTCSAMSIESQMDVALSSNSPSTPRVERVKRIPVSLSDPEDSPDPVYYANCLFCIDWSQTGQAKLIPVDEYSGYPIINGRHVLENDTELEALPPYLEEPPAYGANGLVEPVTFAKYLFQFGFLFPPFWILGALILSSPLRMPDTSTSSDPSSSSWLPDKSEDEKKEILGKMRATEVKWAKRCFVALIVLFVACGCVVLVALCVHKSWGDSTT